MRVNESWLVEVVYVVLLSFRLQQGKVYWVKILDKADCLATSNFRRMEVGSRGTMQEVNQG